MADTVTIAMAEPAPLQRSGTEVLASLEGDEIKVVQVASENQVTALQKALKWCVEQMQGQREENESLAARLAAVERTMSDGDRKAFDGDKRLLGLLEYLGTDWWDHAEGEALGGVPP